MKPGAIFLFACLVAQAGCVGNDVDAAAAPKESDGDSGVRGSILSDELFAVVGATVNVTTGPEAITDESGRFELSLPPGDYELNITAIGYEPITQQIQVPEEAFAEVTIFMTGIPGQAPYSTTLEHVGFDACSFVATYSAMTVPAGACPFGTTTNRWRVEVTKDWAAGVHEMVWKTADNMAFISSVTTADMNHGLNRDGCALFQSNGQTKYDWCPAMVSGRSPLRIFVRPNDTEYAKQHSINGKETWPGGENFTSRLASSYAGYARNEINSTAYNVCGEINAGAGFPRAWGCPFGVGYSTGIRFTYYHTMFYKQAPAGRLEDFTALPDG